MNISSVNGFAASGGTIAYTASKFAVRGMTRTAALEYGEAGIRVNTVHPGGMDTPLHFFGDRRMTPGEERVIYGSNAIPRVGQPAEVANVVLFLASDESSYCTGAEFVADGGRLAGTVNAMTRPAPQPE